MPRIVAAPLEKPGNHLLPDFFSAAGSDFTGFSCARATLMGTVTHIYERLLIRCPYVRAREYLREALEDAADGRNMQTLPLSAPLAYVPGTLEKNVLVRYERGKDPLHFDEPWNVYWTPEGGGPYPNFAGELTVRADESYRGSILELTGDYAPPFGPVGRAFDMVIGAKIASSTARTLLQNIAISMEQRYRTEEAAKTNI